MIGVRNEFPIHFSSVSEKKYSIYFEVFDNVIFASESECHSRKFQIFSVGFAHNICHNFIKMNILFEWKKNGGLSFYILGKTYHNYPGVFPLVIPLQPFRRKSKKEDRVRREGASTQGGTVVYSTFVRTCEHTFLPKFNPNHSTAVHTYCSVLLPYLEHFLLPLCPYTSHGLKGKYLVKKNINLVI